MCVSWILTQGLLVWGIFWVEFTGQSGFFVILSSLLEGYRSYLENMFDFIVQYFAFPFSFNGT